MKIKYRFSNDDEKSLEKAMNFVAIYERVNANVTFILAAIESVTKDCEQYLEFLHKIEEEYQEQCIERGIMPLKDPLFHRITLLSVLLDKIDTADLMIELYNVQADTGNDTPDINPLNN